MTLKREPLLSGILKSLVDEWGYHDVRSQLDKIAKNESVAAVNRSKSPSLEGSAKNAKKMAFDSDAKIDKKIATYLNYLQSIKITSEKRNLISKIMIGFKEKIFLPNTGSVKLFLDNQGISSYNVKQRSDALDKIFEFIVDMPEDRISNIINYEINSGPSNLSSISDAISSKRNIIRSDYEDNTAEGFSDKKDLPTKSVVPDSKKSD